MRRTTRKVPPSKPAPPAPDPSAHTSVEKSGSASARLTVPSTWPIRLRMVVPSATVPRAVRKPVWIQRTSAKVRASLTSIRRAWARVTGSSLQIWATTSVWAHAGSSRSRAKSGSSSSGGRRSAGTSSRSTRGPNPKVTVRREGWAASSGSVSASAACPWPSRSASSLSRRIIRPSSTAVAPSRRSQPTRARWACGAVTTPGWWLPSPGTVCAPAAGAITVGPAPAGSAPAAFATSAEALQPAPAPPNAAAPVRRTRRRSHRGPPAISSRRPARRPRRCRRCRRPSGPCRPSRPRRHRTRPGTYRPRRRRA